VWRVQRNAKALERLQHSLPTVFPQTVLTHALARPLVPPTPRRAVECYWRHHPVRADKLARALADQGRAPDAWVWRLVEGKKAGAADSFRRPPAPFRDRAHAPGPGICCVCGQPVFRYGWHCDLWNEGPNHRAAWHACCVAAWDLWTTPSNYIRHLKQLQNRRCAATGARLLSAAGIDHRDVGWPALLFFWGVPNLQVINRAAHVAKCTAETAERAALVADDKARMKRGPADRATAPS